MNSFARRWTGVVRKARFGEELSFFAQGLWTSAAGSLAAAWRREVADRRLFLWLPCASAMGALAYFCADREPSSLYAGFWLAGAGIGLSIVRRRAAARAALWGFAALAAGFCSAALRTHVVQAPVLDRLRVASVSGFVEEYDPRRTGARFVLRTASVEGLDASRTPFRIRLTTRSDRPLRAGDFIIAKARLIPPADAASPGGWAFSRDAFFARLGAVGNVLGAPRATPAPQAAPLDLRVFALVDHARNALAARIAALSTGPASAVAVAMVTGKRDLLDDATKDVIRQAGIFHIVTISGVQMTLVAAVVFWIARRLLSLSPTLSLTQPLKIWAATIAMAAAVAYDLGTGSRIGEQRALTMTLFALGAMIAGRRALSMRNLAMAIALIVALEPEAILGASFQLSFAAVGGLIAVQEARRATSARRIAEDRLLDRNDKLLVFLERLRIGPGRLLLSGACATSATAAFMAYDFHELSPYVLVGNPLTLAVIEFFAVPCALGGALLYPLGLDGPVWRYLGAGIDFILWVASRLAHAPSASISVTAFSPWALTFIAVGLAGLAIWRTAPMRICAAAPFLLIGLWGAFATARHWDGFAAAGGDAVAVRTSNGRLAVMGPRPNPFMVSEWLSADGDQRPAALAIVGESGDPKRGILCDPLGCVAHQANGDIALVLDPASFADDCSRADVVVSRFVAPSTCGARLILDRDALSTLGAVAWRLQDDAIETSSVRAPQEDRPWSRAPPPARRRSAERIGDSDEDEAFEASPF